MRDGQIDYNQYGEQDLLEIFSQIDRNRFPENFGRLKARLREFGYEVAESGELVRLRPADPHASRNRSLSDGEESASPDSYAALVFFGIAAILLLIGYIKYETSTGDFGPIAELFIFMILASVPAGVGIKLAFQGAKREAGSTLVGNIAMLTAIAFLAGIGLFVLAVVGLTL